MTEDQTDVETAPAPEPGPYEELRDYLTDALGDALAESAIEHDELMLVVPANSLIRVLSFLKDDQNCLFTQLIDLCGVDYPDAEPRFEVVYNLLGMKHNHRIRVKVRTDEETPVPSVISVHPRLAGSSANAGTCMASSSMATRICAAS